MVVTAITRPVRSYFFPFVLTPKPVTLTLTTEAEHEAAVQEFQTLATDEAANYAQLLVLRDAIHAFKEANGHTPGPPTTVAGRRQVEIFKRHLSKRAFGTRQNTKKLRP